MSGVIMDGVQYEHRCQCGKFVAFSKLLHVKVCSDLTSCWLQYEMQDFCTECAEFEIDSEVELQLHDDRRTESYMRACERDSPNSLDFDALVESIYKQLCEENWHAA